MSEKDREVATRVVRVSAASGAYDVHVGAGILGRVGAVARAAAGGGRCCVITETNVGPLYAEGVEASLASAGYHVAERLVFPAGEEHKTLETLGTLLEGLAERELTRDDVVVALGGGVTGDMGGLAAALYLRGCPVVQVPTSLLAMVDSSVGGKTAVDLAAGKNLVGAFWQPAAVVADVRCLRTVPREQLSDSVGEVVKHAVLADPAMLEELTREPVADGTLDDARLVGVVAEKRRDQARRRERRRARVRAQADPQPRSLDRPRNRGRERLFARATARASPPACASSPARAARAGWCSRRPPRASRRRCGRRACPPAPSSAPTS